MFLVQVEPAHDSKNPAKLCVPSHALLDLILGACIKLNNFVKRNVLFELVLLEVELAVELLDRNRHSIFLDDPQDYIIILFLI